MNASYEKGVAERVNMPKRILEDLELSDILGYARGYKWKKNCRHLGTI